jgi:hypothetical protein
MSLTVEVELKEFVALHGLDEVLSEAYSCSIVARTPGTCGVMEWRKSVMKTIAEWCAENIDEDIMLEAYRDE